MKSFKKVWGKGGSNIGSIIGKTLNGEELSEHQKSTLRNFREEVATIITPDSELQQQELIEAEQRAILAESQAKDITAKNERLKAELREAQARLAIEQSVREEEELLSQLKKLQEQEGKSHSTVTTVVNNSTITDEDLDLAIALSLSNINTKSEMEELASKLAQKTIDVTSIRLTKENLTILEQICMDQFSIEIHNAKGLPQYLDEALNLIESNIIGDI